MRGRNRDRLGAVGDVQFGEDVRDGSAARRAKRGHVACVPSGYTRYQVIPGTDTWRSAQQSSDRDDRETRFYMLWPPLAVRATSPAYLAAVLPRPSQQVSLSITHRAPSVATRPPTRSSADALRPRNPCHAEPPRRPCRAPVLRLSRRIKLSRWKGELHHAPDAHEGTRPNWTGSVGVCVTFPIPRREL